MENIKQYLLGDMDMLKDVVRDLNGWDGCLEHLEAYDNDEEFFNVFFEGKPMEAVRASHYGEYEFMDDYVRFNGYGNLESLTEYQYQQELKDEIDNIVDLMIENRSHIHLDGELKELLDESEDSNV